MNIREIKPGKADAEALQAELARLRSLVDSMAATGDAATLLLLDTLARRKALRYDDVAEAVRHLRATIPDYLRGPCLDRFLTTVLQASEERQAKSQPQREWTPAPVPDGRHSEPEGAPV